MTCLPEKETLENLTKNSFHILFPFPEQQSPQSISKCSRYLSCLLNTSPTATPLRIASALSQVVILLFLSILPFKFSLVKLFYPKKKSNYVFLSNTSTSGRWLHPQLANADLLLLDSFHTKILFHSLPLSLLSRYLSALFSLVLDKSVTNTNQLYLRLLYLRKSLNDASLGHFLGLFNYRTYVDTSCYTLTIFRYLALKHALPHSRIIGIQNHCASVEPMMSMFAADTVFSLSRTSSHGYSKLYPNISENPIGSILLSSRSSYSRQSFATVSRTLLIILGNTLHPHGLYYGPNHRQDYQDYLLTLKSLSSLFSNWKFSYLHHKNFTSDYEDQIFQDSSIIRIDPNTCVYNKSLLSHMVVSYSSAVIPELAPYHPHCYIYSTSEPLFIPSSSPYNQSIVGPHQLTQQISSLSSKPSVHLPISDIPSQTEFFRSLVSRLS